MERDCRKHCFGIGDWHMNMGGQGNTKSTGTHDGVRERLVASAL